MRLDVLFFPLVWGSMKWIWLRIHCCLAVLCAPELPEGAVFCFCFFLPIVGSTEDVPFPPNILGWKAPRNNLMICPSESFQRSQTHRTYLFPTSSESLQTFQISNGWAGLFLPLKVHSNLLQHILTQVMFCWWTSSHSLSITNTMFKHKGVLQCMQHQDTLGQRSMIDFVVVSSDLYV